MLCRRRKRGRVPGAGGDPRFMIVSSGRTSGKVRDASHVEASGDFSQLLSTGGGRSGKDRINSWLVRNGTGRRTRVSWEEAGQAL